MSQPKRKQKRQHGKKPAGLQWDLDTELHSQPVATPRPNVTKKVTKKVKLTNAGEGYTYNNTSINKNRGEIPHPPQPPLPLRPCLYGHPATRETIRRTLKALDITNVNQLIRTYDAATLVEAISDYQRAQKTGIRILSPTGYFKTLLK